ncbi:uncharacterized protein LOC112083139 [Eutrema salsugineum]|uniref:uncharacterized protein LOC112083139 n=1 Tax=Eutrema salsugineum TaxID=72664 RepID=UPI000CED18D0|nr:uncharacterized protein LOC112083139 [Eutrema salsugineum]
MAVFLPISYLDGVKPFKTGWRVEVKVLHTWKQYSRMSGETLEVILADQKGQKIYASVKKDHVKTFEKNLREDEEMVYLSANSIDPTDIASTKNPVFTPDFLNSTRVSGLPKHCLRLKIGTPVMFLRNLDPKGGLCNGTKLQITQMARKEFI